jgi:hypothetical protein
MSGQDVGTVRPTQLIYSYGVGSTVDLPQFSAMVMGLDDWPASDMEEIHEDRLLRVVRHVLGAQVRQLKAAPLREDTPGPLFRRSARPIHCARKPSLSRRSSRCMAPPVTIAYSCQRLRVRGAIDT